MVKKTKFMIQQNLLMNSLKRLRGSLAILGAAAMILSAATGVNAQVAGSSTLGVPTEEMKVVCFFAPSTGLENYQMHEGVDFPD